MKTSEGASGYQKAVREIEEIIELIVNPKLWNLFLLIKPKFPLQPIQNKLLRLSRQNKRVYKKRRYFSSGYFKTL
jgi:hypothetical protein